MIYKRVGHLVTWSDYIYLTILPLQSALHHIGM